MWVPRSHTMDEIAIMVTLGLAVLMLVTYVPGFSLILDR